MTFSAIASASRLVSSCGEAVPLPFCAATVSFHLSRFATGGLPSAIVISLWIRPPLIK
jgi:hypothetical protein